MVGFFNPVARKSEPKVRLDLPRIDHWVSVGAQVSERVDQLVKAYRKQAVAAAA
jgi:small subunit ribosomal protein S16